MQDHIDFVVSQWGRRNAGTECFFDENLWPNAEVDKASGKKRAQVLKPFGFRDGEFDVLATLRRSGTPYCLSPTQLYKSLLVTSGAMTHSS